MIRSRQQGQLELKASRVEIRLFCSDWNISRVNAGPLWICKLLQRLGGGPFLNCLVSTKVPLPPRILSGCKPARYPWFTVWSAALLCVAKKLEKKEAFKRQFWINHLACLEKRFLPRTRCWLGTLSTSPTIYISRWCWRGNRWMICRNAFVCYNTKCLVHKRSRSPASSEGWVRAMKYLESCCCRGPH